jgi:hypothetical protein
MYQGYRYLVYYTLRLCLSNFFYEKYREKSTFLRLNIAFLGAKKPKIRIPLGKILDREFPDPQLDFPNDLRDDFVDLLVRIPSSHGGDGTQKNSPHIPGKKILV